MSHRAHADGERLGSYSNVQTSPMVGDACDAANQGEDAASSVETYNAQAGAPDEACRTSVAAAVTGETELAQQRRCRGRASGGRMAGFARTRRRAGRGGHGEEPSIQPAGTAVRGRRRRS